MRDLTRRRLHTLWLGLNIARATLATIYWSIRLAIMF
jgi:hypothetical protein